MMRTWPGPGSGVAGRLVPRLQLRHDRCSGVRCAAARLRHHFWRSPPPSAPAGCAAGTARPGVVHTEQARVAERCLGIPTLVMIAEASGFRGRTMSLIAASTLLLHDHHDAARPKLNYPRLTSWQRLHE